MLKQITITTAGIYALMFSQMLNAQTNGCETHPVLAKALAQHAAPVTRPTTVFQPPATNYRMPAYRPPAPIYYYPPRYNNNSWGNWMPWGNNNGNNSPWDMMPWGNNGYGNNSPWNMMPWSNGNRSGNRWNGNHRQYASNNLNGVGNGAGNGSGAGNGDMSGNTDFSFSISGRSSARSNGNLRGNNAWNGSGYGYNNAYARNGYAYAPYRYAPIAPPVVAKSVAKVEKPAAKVEKPTVVEKPAEPVVKENPDLDTDGVLNAYDMCPGTPANTTVDAFGCAEGAAIVLRGVNFHTNSDKLTDESVGILNRVSETLNAHPELKLEVAGHTDADGDAVYNKDLSQRRANTVMAFLVEKGAKAENMNAMGYGEEKPIASNETPDGKAQNRRVELSKIAE